MWTRAPAPHQAIDALLNQAGRGVVKDGIDRLPHPLASITDGWRGLRRGLPQSYIKLEIAAPGEQYLVWPSAPSAAAPLTLKAEALRLAFKIALALAPRHYSSLVHGVLLVRTNGLTEFITIQPLGRSMVEDVSTSYAVAAAMLVAALALGFVGAKVQQGTGSTFVLH
jgi:hypothetical protein